MRIDKNAILYFCFVIFLFSFTISNHAIIKKRNNLKASYSIGISPIPAKFMKLLSGEFSGLLSDYLLLQIGSYVGSHKRTSRMQWEKIYIGFEQIFELDPYFMQAYIQAQAFIAWDGRMPEKAIKLLEISKQNRIWDWRPAYYIGFNYYYFLKDFKKASDIYLETAKMKNAPVIIAMLGSRFAIKSKQTQASITVLQLMLDETELSDNDIKEIENRIIILKNITILDKAIKQYKHAFNIYPRHLNDLVANGIINKLPFNPYFEEYNYNRTTGEIKFDSVK